MSDKITITPNDSFCCKQVGDDDRVYIKKEQRDNEPIWAIYSPEGECVAQAFSREMAMAIIRQNDLTATQVH